jgi:hypothetical protein
MRYTDFKVFCDQMNSDIETQSVTECLPTVQALRHLQPSACGHDWLVHCGCPSK